MPSGLQTSGHSCWEVSGGSRLNDIPSYGCRMLLLHLVACVRCVVMKSGQRLTRNILFVVALHVSFLRPSSSVCSYTHVSTGSGARNVIF
jgi:hypothetical protein